MAENAKVWRRTTEKKKSPVLLSIFSFLPYFRGLENKSYVQKGILFDWWFDYISDGSSAHTGGSGSGSASKDLSWF